MKSYFKPASALLLSLSSTAAAVTIVTNNTGLPNSSIIVIDNDSPSGFTNNLGGITGLDAGSITFGASALFGNAGSVTYAFDGLTPGLYNIYGTWYSNGDTSANGYAVNGSALATVSITSEPDSTNGFTAYESTVETAAEAEPFQLIGQVSITGTTLDVVVTPEGANGFGRFDAVGISAIPEPSSSLLAGLAALACCLRRSRS